jgi:hypothetical protein
MIDLTESANKEKETDERDIEPLIIYEFIEPRMDLPIQLRIKIVVNGILRYRTKNVPAVSTINKLLEAIKVNPEDIADDMFYEIFEMSA